MPLQTLYFKVADADFAICSSDNREVKKLLPSYAPFHIQKPTNPLIFTTTITNVGGKSTDDMEVNLDAMTEGEEVGQFDCGGCNHGVYRLDEGGYKFVVSNLEGMAVCALKTDALFTQCTVSLLTDKPEDKQFGLGNALMLCFAFSAAHHDIILMHSSVTINHERGNLFLGKSGTGKSTHSRMWMTYIPGSDLLNDDNPAVRALPGEHPIVYGTPWSGKTPCYRNLQYPIGGFVRLEQWPETVIRREMKLQAFASILSSCSTMIWDKPSYNAIARTVERVVGYIPVFYLKCRADKDAAEAYSLRYH